jgi:ribosomal protein S27AE
MEYTPKELAAELQCNPSYIYACIDHGCPSRSTDTERWLIVGADFAAWYKKLMQGQKYSLETDEVFCVRCCAPVKFSGDTQVKRVHATVERLQGTCPQCGATVNRFRRIRREYESAQG